jgi:thiamine-phosphate pyrophosphorylase
LSDTLRIIDANANRAREAMRVMEDAARFLLDDVALTREIKTLRHDLAAAMSGIRGLELHRDTPGDVGTDISTESEQRRASSNEVVIAAGKRLTEALRTIEEYGKTLANPLATVESLRYRSYELERRLHVAMRMTAPRQFRLCLLLTESLCTHHPWQEVLDQAITGGVDCVQVREKHMSDGALLDRLCAVVERCHARGVTVIVNDRPDVALLGGADGVHLGQDDLPVEQVRKFVGRQLLIGVSTSCLEQAKRAAAMGADYCGVGPMFATITKHKDIIVGPDYLKTYLAWEKIPGTGLPGVAIGGIGPGNMTELVRIGVTGVAVSSGICCSKQPGDVARALLSTLTTTSPDQPSSSAS